MTSDFEKQLEQIKKKFIASLKKQISSFKKFDKQCQKQKINKELLQDIKGKSHKIAGSAAMFGFSDLSEIASDFEILLGEIADGQKEENVIELPNFSQKILAQIFQIVGSS